MEERSGECRGDLGSEGQAHAAVVAIGGGDQRFGIFGIVFQRFIPIMFAKLLGVC